MAKKVAATTTKRKFEVVKSLKGVEFWNPKKGEQVEGMYLEMMKFNAKKFGIPDPENPKQKVQFKAVILNDKEEQIALPSTHVLNSFFTDLEKNTYVRITYDGKVLKKGQKKGGESVHQYTIEKEVK